MVAGFQPLAVPQVFFTLVFVVAVWSVVVSCWMNGVPVSAFRGGVAEVAAEAKNRFFTFSMNFASVFMLLASHRFFVAVGSRKKVSVLRFLSFGLVIVSIAGFLGVVGFPEFEDALFRKIMEGMFLYGAAFAFLVCDIILNGIGKRVSWLFFAYDILLIGLATVVLFTHNTPYTEHAAFALTLFRYPVLGFEVVTLRTEPVKQQ